MTAAAVFWALTSFGVLQVQSPVQPQIPPPGGLILGRIVDAASGRQVTDFRGVDEGVPRRRGSRTQHARLGTLSDSLLNEVGRQERDVQVQPFAGPGTRPLGDIDPHEPNPRVPEDPLGLVPRPAEVSRVGASQVRHVEDHGQGDPIRRA